MKRTLTERGITIVELIVATVLLGLAIPLVAGLIVSLTQMNDRAQDTSIINAVAENKIESLRSKGFNAVPVSGPVSFEPELPGTIPPPRSASYTVSTVTTSLKAVDLTITYGGNKTVNYRTYLGELGVGQY